MGEMECVLGQGGGDLQDARGCLVALGSQQAPGLCSNLPVFLLTETPGLLSCLNRLKGADERALCG